MRWGMDRRLHMGKLRRYLLLLCVTSTFFFLSVLIVNVMVDPYLLFKSPKSTANSNFLPRGNASLVLHFKQQQLATASASTAMIGSSRTQRGYDTCHLDIHKSFILGIDTSGILALSEKVIDKVEYSTLIIELGGLLNNTNEAYPTISFIEKLKQSFSLDMLSQSAVKLVALQQFNYNSGKECMPLRTKLEFTENPLLLYKIKRLYDEIFLNPNFTQKLSSSLSQLTQYCTRSPRTADSALQIKLIVGPIHQSLFDLQNVNTIKSQSSAVIEQYQHPACSFSLHVSSGTAASINDGNWDDYNHFKEVLGNAFLKQVIEN